MLKLLDFYADWCGPCKIMAPIFDEIEKNYEGKIEFAKVNVEENPELADKFSVRSIPTFIILNEDKEKDRKLGAMPKETLIKWLDSNIK